MTGNFNVPRRGTRTKRSQFLSGALLAASVALGGCQHNDPVVTASIPDDYRLRHPIVVSEADRSIEIFVGNSRGGLSVSQRADVIALGNTWVREGTGVIIADVPMNTPNARAAADTYREAHALLVSTGVPSNGIKMRAFRPDNPRVFATLRLSYPRIAATAGPCGVWPDDVGPSVKNPSYAQNRQYWNFGCASQRNLAALVANPSDLVQPRPETPAYTNRRTVVLDKYRKGETTATTYGDDSKNKISSVGQ